MGEAGWVLEPSGRELPELGETLKPNRPGALRW
jgi:hypothetical protein